MFYKWFEIVTTKSFIRILDRLPDIVKANYVFEQKIPKKQKTKKSMKECKISKIKEA